MLENAITKISKQYAMTFGSKVWREGILYKTTNIASVFRAAGMWPFYFHIMQRWLNLFKDGGIADSEENTIWMRCHKTIQMEVISLPQEIDRTPQRRWKIDENTWLLSK